MSIPAVQLIGGTGTEAVKLAPVALAMRAAGLLLPVMIAATFLLAVAFAYPAALIGLWLPELNPFAVSLVRTLFFLAPGLVALDEVYGHTHDVLIANPVTGIFEGFRAILLDGTAPALWHLLVPLAYAGALLAIFVPVYRREQRHFAKLL